MFDGIETLARRTWAVNPNRSSRGNRRVCAYTFSTTFMLACHAFKPRYAFSVGMRAFVHGSCPEDLRVKHATAL
jgi:hypothetical protein